MLILAHTSIQHINKYIFFLWVKNSLVGLAIWVLMSLLCWVFLLGYSGFWQRVVFVGAYEQFV